MTVLIDKVLSDSSNDFTDSNDMTFKHTSQYSLPHEKGDSHSNVWGWYASKIKRGEFEEITCNKEKWGQLVQNLDTYLKEEVSTPEFQFKLLILTVPQKLMDKKGDIENFLLNQFKIKNNEVINLNGSEGQDDTDNMLYLIPIYDYDFDILQMYHKNCLSHTDDENNSNTISQVFSLESIASEVDATGSDQGSISGRGESVTEMEVPKIYSSMVSSALSSNPSSNMEDEYLDDERDAIVLNFTRSKTRKRNIPSSKLYEISSNLSETMSVLSIQSNDYYYTDDSTTAPVDVTRENIGENLNFQYIYPSLSRVTAKSGSFWDINLRVCHILGKDYDTNMIWHAIRQSQGEDWIIYDSEFSLNNLQYCQLDDILKGNPIQTNNDKRQMMVMFCKII